MKKKIVKKAVKAKTKVKAKGKGGRKPTPLLHPPTTEAPPEMKDTRPKPNINNNRLPTGEDQAVPAGSETAPQVVPTDNALSASPATAPVPTSRVEILPPAPGVIPNTQLVMGSSCVWWGTMDEAGTRKVDGFPCCPKCGGNLLEMPPAETVERGIQSMESGDYTSVNPPPRPHPGYMGWFKWTRGKCFPTAVASAAVYAAETGIKVDPTR